MKKIFFRGGFAFALTFFYCVAWSQANPDSQLKYIDVIPPSPAVAKIADYSRPDVGLSSGTSQFHLPITSIDLGSVKIPIGLNYSSNGVKVDAISSRVGVDFQLEAGGAITRTVKGNGPDELSTMLNPPLNQSNTSRTFITFFQRVASGNPWGPGMYDSEPDMFTYSFCGNGGKFVMDTAQNVYQIPKTNNRIVHNFTGADWNFKVNDDGGNEYYFGGTGYIETSKRNQSCSHPSTSAIITTAWFLRKIILYNGDVVTFNYVPISYRYDMGVSATMFYQLPAQSLFTGANCACPVNYDNTCVSYIDVNTLYLSSISTTRGQSINMGYSSRNDCGDVLLTSVSKSFNGSEVESFQLNYVNTQANSFSNLLPILSATDVSSRYFLSSVTRFFNGNYINQYLLTYNDPGSLPVRLTYAQDHWGYFNGKNNSTLIPKPSTPDMWDNFPNATADREQDTVLCKKGLLTKIQYVTGGYDSITYQSNTVYQTKIIYPTNHDDVHGTFDGTNNLPQSYSIGTINIEFPQTVTIYLKSTQRGTYVPNGGSQIALAASGYSGYEIGVPTGDQSTFQDGSYTDRTEKIVLQPGVYTVTLYATGAHTEAYGTVIYIPGPPTSVTKNWPVGGVRVRQIVTKSYDGELIGKKKYDYSSAGSSNSSAVMNDTINYQRSYQYGLFCFLANPDGGYLEKENTCSYISMFSSAIGTLFNPSGNSVSYAFVSETFDDTAENGLIEHTFKVVTDAVGGGLLGSTLLGSRPSNASAMNNGKETTTSYYKKNGATYLLVQKTTNYYGFGGLLDILVGVIVNRLYPDEAHYIGPVQPEETAPLEATDYFVYSPWSTLDSVRVDEYPANGGLFSTVTKYTYDPSVLLPSAVSMSDSYGRINQTNNYYSGMSSVPGATFNQRSLFTSMTGKNNIGQLVYQQKQVNGMPVSSNRVIFGQPIGSSCILPTEVKQTNNSSGVEESLFMITKYDAYGNILERKNRDGVLHSFIWNYFGKYPIAETIGSAFSDMDATSFETNDVGGWTFDYSSGYSTSAFFTGRQSYAMTGANPITRVGLSSSQTYTVSFWTYGTNTITVNGITPSLGVNRKGWVYNEVLMPANSTSLTINGTGQIDELRLRPVSASMLTYTFDPDIGMTSATDANNVSTYYEYDGLKRLITVRDDQNNILKANKYQYYHPSKPNTPAK